MNTLFAIHLSCGVTLYRRALGYAAAWRYASRTWGENLRAIEAVQAREVAA